MALPGHSANTHPDTANTETPDKSHTSLGGRKPHLTRHPSRCENKTDMQLGVCCYMGRRVAGLGTCDPSESGRREFQG